MFGNEEHHSRQGGLFFKYTVKFETAVSLKTLIDESKGVLCVIYCK